MVVSSIRRTLTIVAASIGVTAGLGLLEAGAARADAITLQEAADSKQAYLVTQEITTDGQVFTAQPGQKSVSHPLRGGAAFSFRERRLPSGGRDAESFRAVRLFEGAKMRTTVEEHDTVVQLPATARLIVAAGRAEGVSSYCPNRLLTRDLLDLLDVPADPLALAACLPEKAVEVGATWTPADWVAQMLGNVEALSKSDLKCTLKSVNKDVATIELQGTVRGGRLGTDSEALISGTVRCSVQGAHISGADLTFQVKSTIGVINPGLDVKIAVKMKREQTTTAAGLTEEIAAAIPIEPPAIARQLVFEATPWNVELSHDRSWYVFQTMYDTRPNVVILRMMDKGALVAQCNISELATAAPGKHTPIEQFERDIQSSLGKRFGGFDSRERLPLDDGRVVFRAVVDGATSIEGQKGAVDVQMRWIYYLVAAPSGRQLTFVFAVEPSLHEQLGDRDVQMVKSVLFRPTSTAGK